MKCPICRIDHYMLCHSCPHNGQLAGVKYDESPCAVCVLDHKGKPRTNDSREIGHGRVVSLEVIERYVSDELPDEREDGEGGGIEETVLDFIGAFCRLDIRQQHLLEQRVFFGKSLEDAAADYRRTFHRPMTAAGASAAIGAATRRIASALAPTGRTIPAPSTSESRCASF